MKSPSTQIAVLAAVCLVTTSGSALAATVNKNETIEPRTSNMVLTTKSTKSRFLSSSPAVAKAENGIGSMRRRDVFVVDTVDQTQKLDQFILGSGEAAQITGDSEFTVDGDEFTLDADADVAGPNEFSLAAGDPSDGLDQFELDISEFTLEGCASTNDRDDFVVESGEPLQLRDEFILEGNELSGDD
jgi:hypothetical protein